jgi:hypothetical protein
MYNAVPRRYAATELGMKQDAACALCGGRELDPEIPQDWVRCPMVRDRPIGLGCCLDYQGVARAQDFESDALRDLFETLSRRTNQSVAVLRLQCLRHQRQIVSERLPTAAYEEQLELIALAEHISEVAAGIDR